MKPEALVWALLFVVLFASLYRACAEISRRMRRPANPATPVKTMTEAATSASAPNATAAEKTEPYALETVRAASDAAPIRAPDIATPPSPAVPAASGASGAGRPPEVPKQEASPAPADSPKYDLETVRAASDAAPIRAPYIATPPSPAVPAASGASKAPAASASSTAASGRPSVAATVAPPAPPAAAAPPITPISVSPLSAVLVARFAANVQAAGIDTVELLPGREIALRPMPAATRDPSAPTAPLRPAPAFRPADTSLPDDARPFATPNAAATLTKAGPADAPKLAERPPEAKAAAPTTAAAQSQITPDVRATVPAGTDLALRLSPAPQSFNDAQPQFSGTQPDVRATLAPPATDPFLQAPAETAPPVQPSEAGSETRASDSPPRDAAIAAPVVERRDAGSSLAILKQRLGERNRTSRPKIILRAKAPRKRTSKWPGTTAAVLRGLKKSVRLRVLEKTQELRVLGHETTKLISFQRQPTKVAGASRHARRGRVFPAP